MGLLLDVYRSAGTDCSLDGISKYHDSVCVVNVDGPFESSEKHPGVFLVQGPFGTARLIPEDLMDGMFCFGGNFAGTCDSRFSKALEEMNGDKNGIVKMFDRDMAKESRPF